MTYKERLQKEHPEDLIFSGCNGCPKDYGYGPESVHNSYCNNHATCRDCWNTECKDTEKTKTTFAKSDIKPGYLVTVRNGQSFEAVPVGTQDAIILINMSGDWHYLNSCWTEDLRANPNSRAFKNNNEKMDIVEVRGFVGGTSNYRHIKTSLLRDTRPILWQRTETKKMTVSEISKALGYEVEIVAEKE